MKSWITLTIFLGVLRTVNVQFAMPMYQPPPPPMIMMAPPPPPVHIPVGVPFPVPVPVIVTRKTTTTTTTTQSPENEGGGGNFAVAVPLPFGFPMPFAVPQAPPPTFCADKTRPKQCPPCPPCVCYPNCTPAFYSYCSPCHQKCRCKGSSAPAPEPPNPPPPAPLPVLPPMPMPVYPMAPAPPPVFIFPLPPALPYRRPPRRIPDSRNTKESRSSSSDSSSGSSGSSSINSDSDLDWHRRRRRRLRMRRPYRNYRKNARSLETDDDKGTIVEESKLVKPILSYISKNGDVKFQRRISEDDAADLMRDTSQNTEVRRRSVNVARDSRKVMFSAPHNKSITNLTVSFNVV